MNNKGAGRPKIGKNKKYFMIRLDLEYKDAILKEAIKTHRTIGKTVELALDQYLGGANGK